MAWFVFMCLCVTLNKPVVEKSSSNVKPQWFLLCILIPKTSKTSCEYMLRAVPEFSLFTKGLPYFIVQASSVCRSNRDILSLLRDMTSHSVGWPHDVRGVQVQTLKASGVIVLLLLLTYLRVCMRYLTVNHAHRLSSWRDSADVTSYWMSLLSGELWLVSMWFINPEFKYKCESYESIL